MTAKNLKDYLAGFPDDSLVGFLPVKKDGEAIMAYPAEKVNCITDIDTPYIILVLGDPKEIKDEEVEP